MWLRHTVYTGYKVSLFDILITITSISLQVISYMWHHYLYHYITISDRSIAVIRALIVTAEVYWYNAQLIITDII